MEPRVHQLYHKPVHFTPNSKTKTHSISSTGFKDTLTKAEGVKLSRHAEERIQKREILITDKQWKSINEKLDEARQKGITDSLVITNQATLLISVKNNTVVTALDRKEASDKIFTNINGTIMIE